FIPFLFGMIPFGFLAAPLGRDQPNDVWLAARLRFMFKPKKRIWDQTGIQELVTITVPKKEIKHYTDGLNRDQVTSRLRALANTVDSRGWAVKNVILNLSSPERIESPDRLVAPSDIPQMVQDVDVRASDDILDNNANSVAQHFQQMLDDKQQAAKAALAAKMSSNASAPAPQQPEIQPTEQAFLENLHKKQARLGVLPDQVNEVSVSPQAATAIINSNQPQTAPPPPIPSSLPPANAQADPVNSPTESVPSMQQSGIIKQLAENDDFTVATIQQQANRDHDYIDDGFEVSLK
ncbi:PrgI family protein, partial [Candidatus Saccharibacteria bacterium]|nr:PrgI family protein [Candidatus Saccharibacteria bacterium]